ncbi:hypothetical protein CrV_gp108 [Cylindrospermopsis raciborskii virus RM-2018a]|nr:hypothetical protein CrV_gp083 [Cylindrospermopsis raciborskii virus RM-2018a]AXK90518.1 hypothetical protein CrV_gp108 [Cylindrospermopsis raciborskii virus RM-2018a]
MNFKNFEVKISVDGGFKKGALRWSADDLGDVDALEARLVAELDQLAQGLDWEIVEESHSPFWGKSPVDLLHKLPGQFASGAKGKLDGEKVKGLIQESQVIVIGQERGLPRHHVQLLQDRAFNLLVNDPVAFARNASPEKIIEEHFDWNDWMEGVRDREDF